MKKTEIDFKVWTETMMYIFGEQAGALAISWVLVAQYRRRLFDHFGSFPLLFLKGEKGCGKNLLGRVLKDFSWTELELWDEYAECNISEGDFQHLKSGYSPRVMAFGEAKRNGKYDSENGNPTILCGIDYSTRDDFTLFTRCIPLEASGKKGNKNAKLFQEIIDSEVKSIVLPQMDNSIKSAMRAVRKVGMGLEESEFDRRIVANHYLLLATMWWLAENDFCLPIKYDSLRTWCAYNIMDSQVFMNKKFAAIEND